MNKVQAVIGDEPFNENKIRIATSFEDSDSLGDKRREDAVQWPLRAVRHILVPIDLSQDSLTTIRHAIRLGQPFGSRLTLLHVYEGPIVFDIPNGANKEAELLKDQRQAEEILKEQGALVRAAYPNCEWVFRSGDAGKAILDLALQLRVDLIVISSPHHHWRNRYRQTNNAEHILRHASCPILEVSDSGESFLKYRDKIEN